MDAIQEAAAAQHLSNDRNIDLAVYQGAVPRSHSGNIIRRSGQRTAQLGVISCVLLNSKGGVKQKS